MKKQLKYLFVSISILIIISFIVFVINQTNQVVILADNFHPILGRVVSYILLTAFFVLILIPVYLLIRYPKKLVLPKNTNSDEYRKYISDLKKRLAKNKLIKKSGITMDSNAGLENALRIIDSKADDDIQKTASVIFVSTAISQSGKLDAFVVLIMLSKMIWRIAFLYNQRPSIADIIQLYANVAGTAFVAMELDEIDIGEQIDQILGNVIGPSVFGAVPGFEQAAIFITSAIVDGTANAYLSLRVGAITKKYCGSLVKPDRKKLRRYASVEAASALGKIVRSSSMKVLDSVFDLAKKKFGDKVKANWSLIKERFAKALDDSAQFVKNRAAKKAGNIQV